MRKYAAELVGTFALVFCGTGAIVVDQHTGGGIGHAGVAITFGLIVFAMIQAFGEVSGAHLNPAVSLSFAALGRFPRKEVLPYMGAQAMGGLLASGALGLLFPDNEGLGGTHPSGSATQSFVLEFVLTFLLMFVILQVSTGTKEAGIMAGLAIGATVLLEAMFAGPICGASMNPVRSLTPALVSGQLADLWIYLLAPTAGALAAAGVWRALFKR